MTSIESMKKLGVPLENILRHVRITSKRQKKTTAYAIVNLMGILGSNLSIYL